MTWSQNYAPLGSVGVSALIAALPVIDMALCHALRAISVERKDKLAAGQMSLLADYEPVFRHAIHIVVVVSGVPASTLNSPPNTSAAK